jgi:hypothetical protein
MDLADCPGAIFGPRVRRLLKQRDHGPPIVLAVLELVRAVILLSRIRIAVWIRQEQPGGSPSADDEDIIRDCGLSQ